MSADNEYDLLVVASLGCCNTPSNVTSKHSTFGTFLERLKLVVLPSAVWLSILWSERSNVPSVSPSKLPKKTSLTVGAVWKTMILRTSIA